MKLLLCSNCMDIRGLSQWRREAVTCRCERSAAWWENPNTGVARFAQRPGFDPHVWMIGLNNHFLLGVLQSKITIDDEAARALHDVATTAPNYHFDKSRKNCWAIVLRPGMSSDTALVEFAPADLSNRPNWLPIGELK